MKRISQFIALLIVVAVIIGIVGSGIVSNILVGQGMQGWDLLLSNLRWWWEEVSDGYVLYFKGGSRQI